jgi:chlorophyllase
MKRQDELVRKNPNKCVKMMKHLAVSVLTLLYVISVSAKGFARALLSEESTLLMAPGNLTVKRVMLPASSGRDSYDVVLAPRQAGSYPVLVFHHGAALQATDYEDLLTRVASHGFIIMAPQIYSAFALLHTSVQKEQEKAMESQRWAAAKMHLFLSEGVNVDVSQGVIVAGHSRGGGVAFLTAKERAPDDPPLAGFIGVDPVDTNLVPISWLRKSALVQTAPRVDGGHVKLKRGVQSSIDTDPASNANPPIVQVRTSSFKCPSLIFGTGLGSQPPACAPDGSNHVQFYAQCPAEAWHVVAEKGGHMDMLNDHLGWISSACTLACKSSGMRRAVLRDWLGGLIVAFMRDSFKRRLEYPQTQADLLSHHLEHFLQTTPAALEVKTEERKASTLDCTGVNPCLT